MGPRNWTRNPQTVCYYAPLVYCPTAGGTQGENGAALAHREQTAKILGNGAPGSPLIRTIWARATGGELDPNFILRLMAKDLKYSIDAAKQRGLTLKTAAPAVEVFEDAAKNGYGDQDFAAVIEAQRKR